MGLEAFFFLEASRAMPKGASQPCSPPGDLPMTPPNVVPVLGLPSGYFHGRCLPRPKKERISRRGISHTAAVTAQV